MLKKSLLIVGAMIVLMAGYAAIATVFSSDNGQQVKPKQKTPNVRQWDGKAVHIYNAQFSKRVRGSRAVQTVTLERAHFKNLQKAKANVNVVLSVPAQRGRLPKWVNRRAFFAFQSGVAKFYRPSLKTNNQGATFKLVLTFRNVPTLSLGPTCKTTNLTSSPVPLSLNFPGFAGNNFAVVLNAPPAPAGHCLSEPQPKPKKKATINRIKTRNGRVNIAGRSNIKSRFIKVAIRGKRNRNMRVRVRKQRFRVVLKLPRGKYAVKIGYGRRYFDQARFRIRR